MKPVSTSRYISIASQIYRHSLALLLVSVGMTGASGGATSQRATGSYVGNSAGAIAAIAPGQPPADLARQVERAHGIGAWWKTRVLQADLRVEFGGKTIIEGVMTFETNGPKARLDLKSGASAVFDGKTCWVGPGDAKFERARFHVLTWPWFAWAPFKLRGESTRLSDWQSVTWPATRGDSTSESSTSATTSTYWTSKQTFAPGTGDAPDDWYYLMVDPQTRILRGMGYIVTYGKTLEEAEKHQSALVYREYLDTLGMKIPVRWTHHTFTQADGPGKERGQVELKSVRFLPTSDSLFTLPADAIEERLPGE